MHRVTGFVSQREHVVENRWFVIHHDIRRAVVRAVTERARLLALIRIAITPTTSQSFAENAAIFIAKWCQRFADHFNGFIPFVFDFDVTQNWHVGVE